MVFVIAIMWLILCSVVAIGAKSRNRFHKRESLFVLCLFNSIVLLFSQNAYKDYKWVMSVEEVRNISPDLILYKDDEQTIATYGKNVPIRVYRGDFNVLGVYLDCLIDNGICIPNMEPDINEIYFSRKNWLRFFFVEGKLRYIELVAKSDLRESDFLSRYGKPFTQEWNSGGDNPARSLLQDLFINEQDRFILLIISKQWYPKINNRIYQDIDKVLYLDRKWFTSKFKTWFNDYKKETQEKASSILD